jgi:hypothetical protein
VLLDEVGKFLLNHVFSFPCRFYFRMPAPLNFVEIDSPRLSPSSHGVQDLYGYLLISQIILQVQCVGYHLVLWHSEAFSELGHVKDIMHV